MSFVQSIRLTKLQQNHTMSVPMLSETLAKTFKKATINLHYKMKCGITSLHCCWYKLKVRSDKQSVMNSGRLFHARGPAPRRLGLQAMNDVLLAPQERMTMQIAVDGATLLQQQAEWFLVNTAAPCHEDSCRPERTTCKLYVQEHEANVNHSARAWYGRICTNQT